MSESFVDIPRGHTLLCGWNSHAGRVLEELEAAGHSVVVVARHCPEELKNGHVPVIEGDISDDATLKCAGVEMASAAIILAENAEGLPPDIVDARSTLTALAVKSLHPEIYSVLEILNPENERHAKNANVDNVIYCNRTIANYLALCASQRGISDFANDLFSRSDKRSSLNTMELKPQWKGKTVGEAFADIRAQGDLPLGIMRRVDGDSRQVWRHEINPPAATKVEPTMKIIYIRCENNAQRRKRR
ncbi:MAG: potassium channel family protein [Pyramidobacter sp.]|jgi:voltage-gated potassium channel